MAKKEVTFKYTPTRKTFPNKSSGVVDTDKKIYSGMSTDPNVKKNSYDTVSIQGNMHELNIGAEHTVVAYEESHPRWGYSYKIKSIERDVPVDDRSTRKFLDEILTRGQVDSIMGAYPDIVSRVMNDNLDDIDLSRTKGIKEATFEKIKLKIIDNFAISKMIAEFGGLIDFPTLRKLYDKYHSTQMVKTKLSKEPYKSLCELSRVGFRTADKIMLKLERECNELSDQSKEPPLKFNEDLGSSKQRMRSAIDYILQQNESDNQNTRMDLMDLRNKCNALVVKCMPHFAQCIKDSRDLFVIDSEGCISRRIVYEKALYIAGKILNAIDNPVVWDMDPSDYRVTDEGELTDEQFEVLEGVLKHSVHALQGYAGTGKSFSTQMIISMLQDDNKSILLSAPTGRASKVASGYCKMPASTVHRAVVMTDHFQPLYYDVVVVDEMSMTDLDLMYNLVQSIDFSRTKLLLIGDFEQLASVGAGNVFYDLIMSKIIPTTYLTRVFRYGIGGLSTVATKARNGEAYVPNDLKKPMVIGEDKGFMFLPASNENTIKTVVTLYKTLLQQGNKPEDILVLSSQNVGDYGSTVINQKLQVIANKDNMNNCFISSNEREDPTRYYKNDLVIQTKNNYNGHPFFGFDYNDEEMSSRKIFIPNGDIGKMIDINDKGSSCGIRFDDEVMYNNSMLNECKLAYAISLHKSQGGQCKNVILVAPDSHSYMLNSNMLYVGLTRAQVRCFQIGNPASLGRMLKKKENLNRDTNLLYLLDPKRKDSVLGRYDKIVEKMEQDYYGSKLEKERIREKDDDLERFGLTESDFEAIENDDNIPF